MGLLFQMFSVLRCGNVDQAAHAPGQWLAAQVGHAVLGDDQSGIGARRAYRSAKPGHDAAVCLGGGGQGQNRQTSFAAGSTA